MNRQMQYLAEYYSQIAGTITFSGFSEDGFPKFRVKRFDGQVLALELSCDEEGNNPGFMFLDLVKPDILAEEGEMNTPRSNA